MVDFPKRLQVFVSSTYLDLIEERQAAVQAILEAKHIPAGMELFTAGDQSQWEVIKHWIDQSDVYLLILGGRYGSIDKETGKSYTHLEYEYALEKSIPVFSCVLRNPDKRAMEKGDINKYLERDNPAQYKEFKNLVTSKLVRFWENSEQIKTSIILTLKEFEKRSDLIGWVRSNNQLNANLVEEEKAKLTQKNSYLKVQLKSYQQQLTEKESIINQLQKKIQQLESNLSKPSNSTNSTEIGLKSEKGIDYTKLRDLLATGKWREADEETFEVMLKAANPVQQEWFNLEDIDNFPCEDLRTIDQLWVHYSKGKFGFSVQKKIYMDDLSGTRDFNMEIWQEFCDRVGWRKGGDYLSYSDLTFELLNTTPVGHLPGVGAFNDLLALRFAVLWNCEGSALSLFTCGLLSRKDL